MRVAGLLPHHVTLLCVTCAICNSERDCCSGYDTDLGFLPPLFFYNSKEKESLKAREEKEDSPLED